MSALLPALALLAAAQAENTGWVEMPALSGATGLVAGPDALYAGSGITLYKYDLSSGTTGSWTLLAPLKDGGFSRVMTLMTGGDSAVQVYLLPMNGTRNWYRYDSVANKWTSNGPVRALTPFPTNQDVLGGASIVAVHGKIYAFGGQGKFSDGTSSGGMTFWECDLSLKHYLGNPDYDQYTYGEWTRLSDILTAVESGSLLAYGGGNLIYAIPGNAATGLWAYAIDDDRWVFREFRPTPARTVGLVVDEDGILYWLNDSLPNDPSTALVRFHPATYAWRSLAPPPVALSGAFGYPGAGPHLYALQGFGGQFWRYAKSNEAPAAPASLAQFTLDGKVEIAPGDVTLETGFVARASLHDSDGNGTRLQLEFKPVGIPFDESGLIDGVAVASGSVGTATVTGLSLGTKYRWRARALDRLDAASAWVDLGSGDLAETDIHPRSNAGPGVPTALEQFDPASGTALEPGRSISASSLGFRGTVGDPDGDRCRLEIRFRWLESDSGEGTVMAGPMVPDGTRTSFSAPMRPGAYEWEARTVDRWNVASAWVGFGADDNMPDVNVQQVGSLGKASCAGSAGGGTPLLIALAAWMALGVWARPRRASSRRSTSEAA